MARHICRAAVSQLASASPSSISLPNLATCPWGLVALGERGLANTIRHQYQNFSKFNYRENSDQLSSGAVRSHAKFHTYEGSRQSRRRTIPMYQLAVLRPFQQDAYNASLSHEDAISVAAKAQAEEAESISAAAKAQEALEAQEAVEAQEAQETDSRQRITASSDATTLSIKVLEEPVLLSNFDVSKIHPLKRKSFPDTRAEQSDIEQISPPDFDDNQTKKPNDNRAHLDTRQQPNTALLVDTLKIVRRLEEKGMPPDIAESITRVIAETVASNQRRMGELFQDKSQLQTLSLKYQTKRDKVQQQNLETHSRDMQLLNEELESIRIEAKRIHMEINQRTLKSTTDLKLSLSMQRKGVMEEMQALEKTDLETTAQIRQELNRLSLAIVQMKMDIVNFSVGTAGACSGAALAMMRIWAA